MRRWWAVVFRDPNTNPNAGGGGGGAQQGASFSSADIKKIAEEVAREPDLRRAVQNVIETHGGNKDKGIDYALRRGFAARKQRDAAVQENARLSGLVPSDKDYVVRGDDAQHVKTIVEKAKKAGLSLADLANKVETIPAIESENTTLKLSNTAREVAESLKLNKAALAKAVTDDGMVLYKRTITVKKKGQDGKDTNVQEEHYHVRKVDEKEDKGIPVTEYVDKHVFKSAIMSRGTQSDASSSVEWPSQQQSAPSNGGSNSGTANDLVGKTLDSLNKRAEAPSALSFAFNGGGQPTPPHSGGGAQQDTSRR